MKIKWKATIIVIAIILFSVSTANFAFGRFFLQYVEDQEKAQVDMICKNVDTYFNERMTRYAGSVNDWAHWTDPYEFMNGEQPSFVEDNLSEESFENLDINFMIFADPDMSVKDMMYYSFGQEAFISAPDEFLLDMDNLMHTAWLSDDMSCVMKINGGYYFFASSTITDNDQTMPSNGRLLLGKRINENVISDLEALTGSKLSIQPLEAVEPGIEEGRIVLLGYDWVGQREKMEIKLAYRGSAEANTSLMICLVKDRDIYMKAINSIKNFILSFSVLFLVISIVVFTVMGIVMTRPFAAMIHDVRNLDITRNKGDKLSVNGRDEFAYLRETINLMLEEIEVEQRKVKESEERFKITLSSVGDGVIAVDRENRIDFMNPTAQQLTGWTIDDARGRKIDEVYRIISETEQDKSVNIVEDVFRSGEMIEYSDNVIVITKNGQEKSIEETAAPIRDKTGELTGCVLVFRDVSEKKEKRRQIEYLSYHDQLTGLYNRRFFDEELKRLDTGRNLPIALLFADINGLKTINDGFGHNRGDVMICQFADELKKACRSDDIIARTGGDEFVILLPRTDKESVQKLVSRLKIKIDRVKIMGISLSVSFGWEIKVQEAQPIRDVLKKAEDFMYQKKIINSYSKRNEVIKYILNSLLVKSPREKDHSRRVSELCESIAKTYGLSDDETRELRVAGELHDIGKIAIDGIILNKSGALTSEEWEQMKTHPETGYRLLGSSLEYHSIAGCVLEHHERWDGTGYPAGLAGESIEWKARVIALADAYDAMTSDRPYRKALNENEAIAEVVRMAGKQFDPDIARTFIEKVVKADWKDAC